MFHGCRVWDVEYNRSRDQLVLSSSTDSSVNLWKIATLSSDPLGLDDDDEDDDPANKAYNPLIVCVCVCERERERAERAERAER